MTLNTGTVSLRYGPVQTRTAVPSVNNRNGHTTSMYDVRNADVAIAAGLPVKRGASRSANATGFSPDNAILPRFATNVIARGGLRGGLGDECRRECASAHAARYLVIRHTGAEALIRISGSPSQSLLFRSASRNVRTVGMFFAGPGSGMYGNDNRRSATSYRDRPARGDTGMPTGAISESRQEVRFRQERSPWCQ